MFLYILQKKGGNRTVGAPYCRGHPNVTNYYETENSPPKKLSSLTQEEINLLNNLHLIKNYDDFIKKYPHIINVIEGDETIKNKLHILKNNILKNRLTLTQLKNFNK